MPILNYKCNNCDNEFPKLVFSPEKIPSECPACGSSDLEYVGEAFKTDEKDMVRRSCVSCESCGEGACEMD